MGDLVNQVEENSTKPVIKSQIDTSILIPSGLTLLNCACSDNPFGAFALGRIVTIPGASQGGKTILMLNMLAEVCNDKRFDDYDLIYDDAEETMESFDIPYLFGKKLTSRIKAPFYDGDEPVYSNTMQDFKARLLEITSRNKRFIYILDSLDSLTTDEELTREYQNALITAKHKDAVEEIKKSYKTEKAKAIGEALRMINGKLKKSKSALFIVQQVRQKIGASPFERQWITSGGKAPFFYSTHQLYMKKTKTHNPKVGNIKRKIGTRARIEIIKNKINGKERFMDVDVFTDYGMDDIGSCIDLMIESEHWKKIAGGWIVPEGLFGKDEKIQRNVLLKLIQTEGAIPELQKLVGKAWMEIEEKFKIDRPRRFE